MADGGDTDRLVVVGELVDDAIGADPERSQAAQSASEEVSSVGVTFEKPEGVLDGVDLRPVQLEQLKPGAAREDDAVQRSAGGSALCQLAAKVGERHGLVSGEFSQASFQCGDSVGIRQDLRGLF